jgi:hypothetical protein
MGFRMDGRGEMVWPPPKTAKPVAPGDARRFEPCYAEAAEPSHGPTDMLDKASDAMRGPLEILLAHVTPVITGEGWRPRWGERYASPRYRGFWGSHIWVARSFIDIGAGVNKGRGFPEARYFRRRRITTREEAEEIGPLFAAFLVELARWTDDVKGPAS